jgi:hypothetical protein
MKQKLRPCFEDLQADYVLVQAWKKTASYIRYHNWYADTLALDYHSLRLPEFIVDLQDRLRVPLKWTPAPLQVVPAPKSQRWYIDKQNNWRPTSKERIGRKIRPLAHVDLADQVVATAVMLCLADQIENSQGDPRLDIGVPGNRSKVLSYGNRLFCSNADDELWHRWGSRKLYRQYFTDYQTFLKRPDVVSREVQARLAKEQIVIVQSDLSKFYDRVRPELLVNKIRTHVNFDDKEAWIEFLSRFFCWRWHERDHRWQKKYEKESRIAGFDRIALPQGLVASGFFANVVLLDFDNALRESFNKRKYC